MYYDRKFFFIRGNILTAILIKNNLLFSLLGSLYIIPFQWFNMFPFNLEKPTRHLLPKTCSENVSTILIKIIKIYFL